MAKKYKVYARYYQCGYVIVEAESETEAYIKAEEAPDEDFVVDEGGYWDISDCEEVKGGKHEYY